MEYVLYIYYLKNDNGDLQFARKMDPQISRAKLGNNRTTGKAGEGERFPHDIKKQQKRKSLTIITQHFAQGF